MSINGQPGRHVIMQRGITRSGTYVMFVADRSCSLSTAVCVAAAAGVGAWTAIPFLNDDDAAPHDAPQRRYPYLTFVPRRRRRRRQRRRTSHPHRRTEKRRKGAVACSIPRPVSVTLSLSLARDNARVAIVHLIQ